MKAVFTSLFLLALLPATYGHPSNPLEARASCPTCDPTSGKNRCDLTTSCIQLPTALGGGDVCACRAGYRPVDASAGFRLNWTSAQGISQQGRVFVATGTPCNTLCDNWQLGKDGCTEVPLKQTCAY